MPRFDAQLSLCLLSLLGWASFDALHGATVLVLCLLAPRCAWSTLFESKVESKPNFMPEKHPTPILHFKMQEGFETL